MRGLQAVFAVAAAGVANAVIVGTNGSSVPLVPRADRNHGAYHGTATWYDVETYIEGACGQWIDNSMHIVALNQPMYGDLNSHSSWCGKKIMIANGLKTRRAVIRDACPETRQCHHGALDMLSLIHISEPTRRS